jgi:uncharacterized membrane protein
MTSIVRQIAIATSAAVLAMLAVSAWGWTQIPDDAQVPIHWGIEGQPDGFAPKPVGLLAIPASAVLIGAILAVVPLVEPRRENLLRSSSAYRVLAIGVLGMLTVLHAAAVFAATGGAVDIGGLAFAAAGAMFVIIGNVLGKVRSNFMFGIRTPWTLTSDRSWDRTHRLGGRLMVALGLAVLGATLLGLPAGSSVAILGVGAAVLVGVLFVYSYVVWRSDPDRRRFGS